jgi:HemY protein
LFMEARRRDDPVAARLYAEEAALAAPALAWAGHAVLEFRCVGGDWTGALDVVERNYQSGLIDKPAYRRQRAVLLTARALAVEDSDPASAKAFALEAAKLAPNLVPAAALAGRLLGEAGELRRAGRIVDAAWRANPHPDLAETYAHLRFGDSARDRLKRVQALAQKAPGNIESALAVARAALDAQEFAAARSALAPLLVAPTRRVAMLMAELEQTEHGDEGRAREWTTRALHAGRDPAWTADGVVSDRWMPVSPVTGQLDAFQWKLPLAELASTGKVIEAVEKPAPIEPEGPEIEAAPAPAAAPASATDLSAAPAPPAAGAVRRRRRTTLPAVEPVIPLVRAPDDPGPDAEPLTEPVASPDNPSGGWRRPLR